MTSSSANGEESQGECLAAEGRRRPMPIWPLWAGLFALWIVGFVVGITRLPLPLERLPNWGAGGFLHLRLTSPTVGALLFNLVTACLNFVVSAATLGLGGVVSALSAGHAIGAVCGLTRGVGFPYLPAAALLLAEIAHGLIVTGAGALGTRVSLALWLRRRPFFRWAGHRRQVLHVGEMFALLLSVTILSGWAADFILQAPQAGERSGEWRIGFGATEAHWSGDSRYVIFKPPGRFRAVELTGVVVSGGSRGAAASPSPNLTGLPRGAAALAWRPNQQQVAAVVMGPSRQDPDQLLLYDVAKNTSTGLDEGLPQGWYLSPCWSPDGSCLALLVGKPDPSKKYLVGLAQVWVHDMDTASWRQVVVETPEGSLPIRTVASKYVALGQLAWASDGASLFVPSSQPKVPLGIWQVRLDGKVLNMLPDTFAYVPSPDGSKAVSIPAAPRGKYRYYTAEILRLKPGGSEVIEDLRVSIPVVSWSPDSRWIAFVRDVFVYVRHAPD